jgi:hypothetical protein
MSNNTVATICSTFAVALTATAGMFVLATRSEAAPACDWQFQNSFSLTQSDGYVLSVTPKDPKDVVGGQRQASMDGPGLKEFLGNPNGKIVGDRLQLTIQWEGGPCDTASSVAGAAVHTPKRAEFAKA